MAKNSKLFTEYTDYETQYIKKLVVAAQERKLLPPAMQRLLQVKERISIFQTLSEDDVMNVVKNVNFKKYKAKELLMKQGAKSQEMCFVLMGECDVYVNFTRVGTIKPGQVLGEVAAIFEKPRNATVISTKNTTAVLSFELNKDKHELYAYAFSMVFQNLAKELSKKLELLNDELLKQDKK